MEVERLSRLAKLTPLVTSYESLSEEGKLEVATSLQNTTEDSPSGCADAPDTANVPPLSAAREDPTDSAPDEVIPDLRSLAITTEPADSEPSPTQTTADSSEGPAAHAPGQVSSMLVALYSSFLVSARQMGVTLSPRIVLPRHEERDDETRVTQELSQAQRKLVIEEESIWKKLLETKSKDGIEDVSFMARELEDKSAKILTSYERRNNPPTNEVYDQSQIILRAMGIPCIDTKDGVEGEALAVAMVRDGLADYVASEDTVSFFLAHIFVG